MTPPAHKNSFDLLRLLFAISVILTHSYPILGLEDTDLLSRLSNDTYHYANIAVPGFFVISGFLVIQSLRQSPGIINFLSKRFARIYPGLFVMLLVVLLFGWLVYSGTFSHYIHDRNNYSYVVKKLLMMDKTVIFGFFDRNPVPSIINVSLWSIPYEVLFYLILSLFFFIPFRLHLPIAVVVYFTLLINLILTDHQVGILKFEFESIVSYNIYRYGPFFFGGVALGLIPHIIQRHYKALFTIFSVAMLSLLCLSLPIYVLILVLPVWVISLGLSRQPKWLDTLFRKTGDVSYGIYIYGFPIQQTLIYFLKMNYWQHAISSVLIAYTIGCLSWHFVEKPALYFVRKKLKASRWSR